MEQRGARRRPLTLAALALACALASSAPLGAQSPLDALLQRVGDYTAFFVERFANVVAEEQYRRSSPAMIQLMRYRSDFLLVRYPGEEQTWLTFRDVREINGKPVRNADDRMLRLFAAPFDDALQRATEIHRESSRYFGVWSNPLLALSFAQKHYQARFRFSLAGRDRDLGPRVVELKYSEVVQPTILQQAVYQRPNLPAKGAIWLDEETGRIVKTQLLLGVAPNTTIVDTTFRPDESLQINVPVELRESYGTVTGVATYGAFRRFQVQTSEQLAPAPGAAPTQ
jgi:hypothetical protein